VFVSFRYCSCHSMTEGCEIMRPPRQRPWCRCTTCSVVNLALLIPIGLLTFREGPGNLFLRRLQRESSNYCVKYVDAAVGYVVAYSRYIMTITGCAGCSNPCEVEQQEQQQQAEQLPADTAGKGTRNSLTNIFISAK